MRLKRKEGDQYPRASADEWLNVGCCALSCLDLVFLILGAGSLIIVLANGCLK
jgi:hypothetical protein